MGNSEKAILSWEEALRIEGDYCKAHNNIAFLHFQAQQWQESLTAFHSSLTHCPQNVIAHYGLGLLFYKPIYDKKKAIFHLDQVLRINPNFDYAADAREKLLELTW